MAQPPTSSLPPTWARAFSHTNHCPPPSQLAHPPCFSGQEILDPREFMDRARNEMGAQSEADWRASQPATSNSFTGTGHTTSGADVEGAPVPQQPQEHTITFWQNGFTVDDGPLRTRDDPASAAFLSDVNRGALHTCGWELCPPPSYPPFALRPPHHRTSTSLPSPPRSTSCSPPLHKVSQT